jgi:hypothetical protein
VSGLDRLRRHFLAVGLSVGLLTAAVGLVLALGGHSRQPTDPQGYRLASPTTPATVASSQPNLPVAIVRIPASGGAVSVPRSFLGVSTEYWTIPVWAKHLSLLGRVLSTITPYRPMVLRIGGSSADQAFWAPRTEKPEWVYAIITHFRVRVILDLNLVTASPQIAVRWARAAEAALPAESVVGFEIGNEADIYSQASWREVTGGRADSSSLPRQMTAAGYARSYLTYARALARVDRGVPLFGPALSNPASNLSWISRLLADSHPRLGAITVHRYPLSACAHPGSRLFPTIARVLGERATAGMARSIAGAVRVSRLAGLPVRLTEINSVTCGGRQGVSDTFATALWAPDALFELLHAGARSAAVHVRANAINMAFSLTRRGLVAHPLLYGLALFSRTLGTDPQLLSLHLAAPKSHGLKVWAVRVQGNVAHVLLINKGSCTMRVDLHIPGAGLMRAQQLLAPSARASSGVTLGGQRLDAHGRWTGKPRFDLVHRGVHGYQVIVRGISATLLTVRLAPGAVSITAGSQ